MKTMLLDEDKVIYICLRYNMIKMVNMIQH